MARFFVFKNNNDNGYLLDVQSDILGGLNTRAVVPLVEKNEAPRTAMYLNPTFEIQGEQYVMLTQFIAAIPESELTDHVADLNDFHAEIVAALDMLLTGF